MALALFCAIVFHAEGSGSAFTEKANRMLGFAWMWACAFDVLLIAALWR